MRCLFTASLAAAGIAGTLAHRVGDGPVRHRKSLGFGPVHKHAYYRSSPYQVVTNAFTRRSDDADPFEVARSFIEDILGNQLSESSSYKIRKDSYTDKATGITHVYVRQIINGLEVSDGDMNINIKDGMVLSYGNSFFTGPAPSHFMQQSLDDDIRHPHQEFCDGLTDEIELNYNSFLATQPDQVVMGDSAPTPKVDKALKHLTHVHHSNCRFQQLPTDMAVQTAERDIDLRSALLQFMVAATPNDHVVNDILGNFEHYLSKMVEYMQGNHFAPSDEPAYVMVDNVPDAVNPVKATLAYHQVPGKDDSVHLSLVWKFEVEMQDNWYEAAVSAIAPHRIVSVVDWASDAPVPIPEPEKTATYNVFAFGINDPEEGKRTIEKESFDSLASPVGWHSLPYANDPSFRGVKLTTKEFYRNTTTTWGNNVFAQENWEGQNAYVSNYRPDAGPGKAFDYPYKPKETDKGDALEEAQKYINATVAQLFYTTNIIHDLYYRYGFDEVSGNFQQYNFGRGGEGNDAVIANAQDGSGYNNANFMTPPDGQNGRMRMYLWNTALPYRDGDFEAGIVIHELSHGLSTRLTGGPLNSGCLPFGESGGMGEGWGDFLATTIRSTANYSDYAMGSWAANRVQGIRNYPYSLNETINPSTYKTLDKPGYFGVHAVGEVWAQMLWVVSQGLIEKHGFTDTLFPPAPNADGTVPEGDFYRPKSGKKPLVPKHGNSLSVQLVLNAMKLQPCRPGFFEARDAIILADQQLTGGENFCTLWKGFSSKGLGPDANVVLRTPWGGGVRTDDFEVPLACDSY
ncbi:Extracellular metalloproteinase [Mycena venus]|uniref:Extracellular metalloproteinase n=1 Tax=Mycena venus TaxID=2733690 RepID=A0A8H6WUN1_9AGAR|nr:Extracellular metalloproteinase [Mycena venus]